MEEDCLMYVCGDGAKMARDVKAKVHPGPWDHPRTLGVGLR